MGNCSGSVPPRRISKPDERSNDSSYPWLVDEYGLASLSSPDFPPLSNQDKLERLRTVKLFILDNSVRESTVAQNRGHTFADKFKILDNVKSCKGIQHQLIANFVTRPRVDDLFIKEFNSVPHPEYDGQIYYCFSELFDTVVDGIPSMDVPIGCLRASEYGVKHLMLEFDLMNPVINWEGMTMEYYCRIFTHRFSWIRENINKHANIFVNIRDFSVTWDNEPRRIAAVVHFLSTLPAEVRIFGLCFEDPLADVLPLSVCEQARRTRAIMNAGGWTDAHFLCHIHNGYGLAEATVLEFLVGGGDGIWCSISRVGAASGHANSLTTVYNLHRLGNEYVQNTYSLPAMRKAAIEITRITTGKDPDQRTELYGSRAIDIWFDGSVMPHDPKMGNTMEVKQRTRVSILATPQMVQASLIEYFGERDGTPPLLRKNIHAKSPKGREVEIKPYIKEWDLNICARMLNTMHQDLNANRKEEIDTAVGLCSLYERSGGVPDAAMLEVIADDEEVNNHKVLLELHEYYDAWAFAGAGLEANSMKTGMTGEDRGLTYQQFFEAFLKDELTSFESTQAKEVFEILDFDQNGMIDWNEIVYRVKWVLQEYPDECTSIKDTIHCLYENFLELEVEHHKRQQLAQKRIGKWKEVARQIIKEVPKHKKSIEDVRLGSISQEELSKELLAAIPGLPISRQPSFDTSVSTISDPPSPEAVIASPQSRPASVRFRPPTSLERRTSKMGGDVASGDAAASVKDVTPSKTGNNTSLSRVQSIRFVPPTVLERKQSRHQIDSFGFGSSGTPTVSPSKDLPPLSKKHSRFIPPTALERQRSRSKGGELDLNMSFLDTRDESRSRTGSNAQSFYIAPDGRRHVSSMYHIRDVSDELTEMNGSMISRSPFSGSEHHLVISVIEEDEYQEDDD